MNQPRRTARQRRSPERSAVFERLLALVEASPQHETDAEAWAAATAALGLLPLTDVAVLHARTRKREHTSRIRVPILELAENLVAGSGSAAAPLWRRGHERRGDALVRLAAVPPAPRAEALEAMVARLNLTRPNLELLRVMHTCGNREECLLGELIVRMRALPIRLEIDATSLDGTLRSRVDIEFGPPHAPEVSLTVLLTHLLRAGADPEVSAETVHRATLTLWPGEHDFVVGGRFAAGLVARTRATLAAR